MGAPEFNWDAIMGEVDGVLHNKQLPPSAHTEESFRENSQKSASDTTEKDLTEEINKRAFVEYFVRQQALPKVTTNIDPMLFAREFKNIFVDAQLGAVANLTKNNRRDVADAVAKCQIADVIGFIPVESGAYERKLAGYKAGTKEYQYTDRMIKRLDIILHAAEEAQKL